MPSIPLISIVDDDDALRMALENLIRSVGLRAQGFSSAEAFLRSNQLHETACLILDVCMPGMSGLELTTHFRNQPNGKRPCIISVTSYAMDSDRERAFAAGCDGYITKPIDTRMFADEVLRIMSARAHTEAVGASA